MSTPFSCGSHTDKRLTFIHKGLFLQISRNWLESTLNKHLIVYDMFITVTIREGPSIRVCLTRLEHSSQSPPCRPRDHLLWLVKCYPGGNKVEASHLTPDLCHVEGPVVREVPVVHWHFVSTQTCPDGRSRREVHDRLEWGIMHVNNSKTARVL